jgi:hypothetical protein
MNHERKKMSDQRRNAIYYLLPLFEQNKKTPSDHFKISPELDDTELRLTIYYNGEECSCILFDTSKVKNETYGFEIETLQRCSSERKNGTQTLLILIEFAKIAYDFITLTNTSEISFDPENTGDMLSIDLTLLKLLINGNSWYAQFGFQSITENPGDIPVSLFNQPIFQRNIHTGFQDLIAKYDTYIDRFVIKEADQDFLKKKYDIESMMNELHKIFGITGRGSISSYFSLLQENIHSKKLEITNRIITIINNFIDVIVLMIVRIEQNKRFDIPDETILDDLLLQYRHLILRIERTYGGKRKTKQMKHKKKRRITKRKIRK